MKREKIYIEFIPIELFLAMTCGGITMKFYCNKHLSRGSRQHAYMPTIFFLFFLLSYCLHNDFFRNYTESDFEVVAAAAKVSRLEKHSCTVKKWLKLLINVCHLTFMETKRLQNNFAAAAGSINQRRKNFVVQFKNRFK